MGKIKDLQIDKMNYIKYRHDDIIKELAYNYAKDEAFAHLIFDDEDDLVLQGGNGINCYHEDFQPIFDRHYDFIFSIFEKNIIWP